MTAVCRNCWVGVEFHIEDKCPFEASSFVEASAEELFERWAQNTPQTGIEILEVTDDNLSPRGPRF